MDSDKKQEFKVECVTVKNWGDFLKVKEKLGDSWVFRGDSDDRPLKTTLERACEDYSVDIVSSEKALISDFQRRYDGQDRELVKADTLYCLSLMQHHGSPTRLLDFSYSPYIALYFALKEKKAESSSVVWCINSSWCKESAKTILGEKWVENRNSDERDNKSFKKYLRNQKQFVFLENPFSLNHRLIIQQGVFLCPGKLTSLCSFELNLKMPEHDKKKNLIKIKITMNKEAHIKSLKELYRMNINEASLFPGIDGFARSLKTKLLMRK